MKNRILNLLVITFLFQFSMMAQSLKSHLWQDRVILLFADDFQHITLQKQLQLFEKNPEGLKERKLVVYQITPNAIRKNGEDFFEKNFEENICKEFNPKNDEFAFVLIGLILESPFFPPFYLS